MNIFLILWLGLQPIRHQQHETFDVYDCVHNHHKFPCNEHVTNKSDNMYNKTEAKPAKLNKTDIEADKSSRHIPIPVCDAQARKSAYDVKTAYSKCNALIQGDPKEQEEAFKYMNYHQRRIVPDEKVVRDTSSCEGIRSRYRQCALSEEERDFPVAFSILCHKDSEQVERLLRAIYHPQNVYCLHPDAKSSTHFHTALKNIALCLPNVFIASRLETVVYESYSRLQADINCMKDLIARPEKWTYMINIVGQAFPLKTNKELVQILQVYNGGNDIEGLPLNKFMHKRVNEVYSVKIKGNGYRYLASDYRRNQRPVPGNLTLVRGSAYGVFTRAFLHFATTEKLPLDLLKWSENTKTPDEHFWATLHHLQYNPSLHSPGGYHGPIEIKEWMASYSSWHGSKDKCYSGRYVRLICIFGIKDLPQLVSRHELFANKFYSDYQHLTLKCLEEWLNDRNNNPLPFNLTFYRNLAFVRERSGE